MSNRIYDVSSKSTPLFIFIAVVLYFVLGYFVSMLNSNFLMEKIAHKHKALTERIALMSTKYFYNSDVINQQCIIDNLNLDLNLLDSSNKAISCSKRTGSMLDSYEDKVNMLYIQESINEIENYISHGKKLVKFNETLTLENKELLYLLGQINDGLLDDLKKIIELRKKESDNELVLVKNTEKIFTVVIWLIIMSALSSYIAPAQINVSNVKKILVAEDNRVNAEFVKTIIENHGYQVMIAKNGQEVLDVLNIDRGFSVIFMDCEMPIMDGFEATANIRQKEKQKELDAIPIVALTANVSQDYKDRCFEMGMNDYLPKPTSENEIGSMIKKWLSR